jgi:two-component system CheB/CheR fusion protein
MGLGLALARSIVEAHGGDILARSDGADQGSEFRVRLPLTEATSPPVRSDEDAAASPLVVVVEDQDDTRELVCALLTKSGYRTQGARDGHEGLRTIVERRPRVALVDVGMPGIDGCEVARRVHVELGEARPFLVAVTGYGQDHDRAAVRQAGFDRHVVKPFELEHLLSVLQEAFAPVATGPGVN